MAYIDEFNRRLSVTLSKYALDVIRSDLYRFNYPKRSNKENLSGFLNLIFENHRSNLVDVREFVEERLNKLDFIKLSSTQHRILHKNFVELLETISYASPSKEKSIAIKFLINAKNTDIINMMSDLSTYNNTPVTYLRAIFESYARFTTLERELIIFKDIIEKLNVAISKSKQVSIKLFNNSIHIFKPYKLVQSVLNQTNELVGEIKVRNNFMFKVIKVLQIKEVSLNPQTFKHLDIESIKNYPNEKLTTFIVQLTNKGVEQFNNQYEHRPNHEAQTPEEQDNNIYRFETTENKILLYFLKFGPNAKILAPNETADLFKDIFKFAYDQYNI